MPVLIQLHRETAVPGDHCREDWSAWPSQPHPTFYQTNVALTLPQIQHRAPWTLKTFMKWFLCLSPLLLPFMHQVASQVLLGCDMSIYMLWKHGTMALHSMTVFLSAWIQLPRECMALTFLTWNFCFPLNMKPAHTPGHLCNGTHMWVILWMKTLEYG